MKYIRTKNFVVELETWMKIDGDILTIGGAKHKIVKQADTIEELCDEFVAITYDNNHILYDDEVSDWKTREEYSKLKFEVAKGFVGKDTIYGAIWTDKGLIYVAKLNDEGELELL